MMSCNASTSSPNGSTLVRDSVFIGLYSLIFTLGLALNLAALFVFFRCLLIRSITMVYMKNLAFSDLLLVASLPVRIYYYSKKTQLHSLACELVGLVLLVNMYTSIFLLTCISWDRCMAVCFPMRPWIKRVRKKAGFICLGVWILSITASIPAYLVKKFTRFDNCTQCFDCTPEYATSPVPIAASLSIGFTFPLVIMAACSWALVRAIRKSMAAQMELVNSEKIRHMILANLAIFLLCFLPYHAVLALYLTGTLEVRLTHDIYYCTLLATCFNTVLDPLAYYFATETFQKMVVADNLRKILRSRTDSCEAQNQS
ncbi:lysophosphatidic acid receptor 4 isoform X2 [Microcaecilia unicolor]|nr:lysophosphatidic acid receptor 4-like isoform X2 [Microcaecilia unicolor]XP_030042809.1 lysophosphatidic acid receptor 4-like isoform X2 [Microcaecilia unicolor]XP_030042811.1 lysophosphatidic acid receptor 4-like isoform X2 [Microcaecilia unicolor]